MHSLLELIKRAAPRSLKQRLKRQLEDYWDVPTVERSLRGMRRLGYRPATVVDVGAYKGEWTALAVGIFPEASFLMLEAQQDLQHALEAARQSLGPRVDYRIALLGAEDRENVAFYELTDAPTGSSVLSYREGGATKTVNRRMQTLDAVLLQAGMPQPDLIKLDVQGYELEVLKGGANSLPHVSAILMEVSIFELYEDNPLLHDVLAVMSGYGFVVYDICSIMRRPSDGVLAQIDMIFVRPDSLLGRQRQIRSQGQSIQRENRAARCATF